MRRFVLSGLLAIAGAGCAILTTESPEPEPVVWVFNQEFVQTRLAPDKLTPILPKQALFQCSHEWRNRTPRPSVDLVTAYGVVIAASGKAQPGLGLVLALNWYFRNLGEEDDRRSFVEQCMRASGYTTKVDATEKTEG